MASRSSLSPGAGPAAKARTISRASAPRPDVDAPGMIVMFCGAGLVVALFLASFGIDISAGFY
jgi:hypothetical protein